MNYIVDPSWFYWLHVVGQLSDIVMSLLGLALFVLIISIIIFILCAICSDDDLNKVAKKFAKPLFVIASITVVLSILYVFIPSKETMISMMVAKFATYENAQWTLDTVKAAVDYIVNAMQQIG